MKIQLAVEANDNLIQDQLDLSRECFDELVYFNPV